MGNYRLFATMVVNVEKNFQPLLVNAVNDLYSGVNTKTRERYTLLYIIALEGLKYHFNLRNILIRPGFKFLNRKNFIY